MKFKAITTNGKTKAPYRVVETNNAEVDKAYNEALSLAKIDNHLFDLGWLVEVERI